MRCPFHPDRGPSLSLDLARGLWRCHGACQRGGGLRDFAENAGLTWAGASPAALVTEDDLRRAEGDRLVAEARARASLWARADLARECSLWADMLRGAASSQDPDAAETWDALRLAADFDRLAHAGLETEAAR